MTDVKAQCHYCKETFDVHTGVVYDSSEAWVDQTVGTVPVCESCLVSDAHQANLSNQFSMGEM